MVDLCQLALAIEPVKGPRASVGPAGITELRVLNILTLPQCEPGGSGLSNQEIRTEYYLIKVTIECSKKVWKFPFGLAPIYMEVSILFFFLLEPFPC